MRQAKPGALLDYAAFYGAYCPDARCAGQRLRAHCPIPSHQHSGHGKPSMSADLNRGLWHCFSRHEGGDAVRFYQLMHGVSFADATRRLSTHHVLNKSGRRRITSKRTTSRQVDTRFAAAPGLAVESDKFDAICECFLEICRRQDQKEGETYLTRRGISNHAIAGAGIAYFPMRSYGSVMRHLVRHFALEDLKECGLFNAESRLTFYRHRLIFPFFLEGRPVYVQGRSIRPGVEPRWHNLRAPVPALYNVDSLSCLSTGTIVYLVEGLTDTLTLLSHGFAAVGIAGAAGFKDEWLALLGRFRLVSTLDGDAAGERATACYRELFASRGISLRQIRLRGDVNDFFCRNPAAPLEFTLLTEAALEDTVTGGESNRMSGSGATAGHWIHGSANC